MSPDDLAPSKTAATRRPLQQAFMLPGDVYVSTGIYKRELDRVFSKMWIAVGRDMDLPSPGSFLTRQMGDECVLLVRDKEGIVRALYNVCRHRGARLIRESDGELQHIRCSYHGWTYGLDGRLIGAPLADRIEDFAKEDFPIVPIRLESWEGFLFINLDEDAAPLHRQMEGFPDVARYRLPELRRGSRLVYDVSANWKLIAENYGECYHCPIAHPQLNRISDYQSGGRNQVGPGFAGGPMTLNEGFNTMSMSGFTRRRSIPKLPADDHSNIYYYNLYPNFLLSLHPDYVMTHTIWPTDPTHSQVICDLLFPREAVAEEDFDPSDAVEFWDLTNRQDWELCEMTQKGVHSRGYRPGRYQTGEGNVHAFDNWYLDQMNYR